MSDRETLARAVAARIASRFERAWDDGNAVGLDGWVGPDRGTEPDGEAIRYRERTVDRLVEETIDLLDRFVVVDREAPMPDDMIERGAVALYESLNDESWSSVGPIYGDFIRRKVCAALSAALGVTA